MKADDKAGWEGSGVLNNRQTDKFLTDKKDTFLRRTDTRLSDRKEEKIQCYEPVNAKIYSRSDPCTIPRPAGQNKTKGSRGEGAGPRAPALSEHAAARLPGSRPRDQSPRAGGGRSG